MDLTLLLTCKDREYNLKYCLKSIQAVSNKPKVILVDFGSLKPLTVYKDMYDWLTIIRVNKNTKLFHKSRALNIALRYVKTKYVCASDVDQIFNPNFFDILYSTLSTQKKAFIMCKTYFIHRIKDAVLNESSYSDLLTIAKKQTRELYGDGCCNGVETEWLRKVQGWDEQYLGYGAEDSDLALRAALSGFKIIWIDNRTNMIHLPHRKQGSYYSVSFINRNKKIFLNKRKTRPSVIANIGFKWGQL